MTVIRLQKFLSQSGVCSRRKGEEYITTGRVRVNGRVVTELGTKIDPDKDHVEFNGKPIEPEKKLIYIMLNKPEGYVTTCSQKGEKTVIDLLNIQERVYPVGRLDKDSTGLILLTNDGNLHMKLSHPSFDHEKEYDVTVASPISDAALNAIETGMPILGSRTRPAKTKRISKTRFKITLQEGRNRQIRRMVNKLGNSVTELKRIRISTINLGNLKEGRWRHLTEKEKKNLLNSIKSSNNSK